MAQSRYPEPELSPKAEKIHYWFNNGNRALAMVLTDTDDRLERIEEDVKDIRANMATKADVKDLATKADIARLEKLIERAIDKDIVDRNGKLEAETRNVRR